MASIKSSFADRGNLSNLSINMEEPQDEKHSTSSLFTTPRYILLTILGAAYILSFLVNLRVIHIVHSRLSKRVKTRYSVSVLVGHLSLICIGITIFSALDTRHSEHLLKILGPLVCRVADFFKDSLVCAFALNTVLIVNERVRTITDFHESPHVYRIFGMLWFMAATQEIVARVLSYFKGLQLANLKLAVSIIGVTFEVLRFLIFYLGVGIKISHALCKVHRKLGQFQMPCRRLKSKMENIICLYIHLAIFIIAWITYGIWHTYLRCAFFLELDLQPNSTLTEYIQLGFHAYLVLHPLLHILLLDGKIDYLWMKRRLTRDENMEGATGIMDDEYSTTVSLTNLGAIEEQRAKLNMQMTLIRELSSSPVHLRSYRDYSPPQRLNVQHEQADNYSDIPYIDMDSDKESIFEEVEYTVVDRDQPKKVSITNTVSTYYDDDEDSDESEGKDDVPMGKVDTSEWGVKETSV